MNLKEYTVIIIGSRRCVTTERKFVIKALSERQAATLAEERARRVGLVNPKASKVR